MSKLLEELNPAQREAVTHKDGPLLIIAGPGSGKTRTIAYSIAYAIEKGEDPSKIAAFTFTRKAAGELKKRVDEIVDEIVGKGITNNAQISTFHSFCGSVVNADFDSLRIDDEQEFIVKELTTRAEIDYIQYHNFPESDDILRFIRLCQANNAAGSNAKEYAPDPQMLDVYVDIYKKYEHLEDDGNPYTRVQLLTYALFRDIPEVRAKWQEKYSLIFVDEYQDTDSIQYKIIKALAEKHQNLRVVGDDDQGIYGWRGANIQNILNFEENYRNPKVIRLGQNYRSTKQIVAASSALADFNPDRRDKDLFTWNFEGEKVKYLDCDNDEEEAATIACFIQQFINKGNWRPSDFAVLCRSTDWQSPVLKSAFENSEIPCHVVKDDSEMSKNGVHIMTIHKSKGLEFPNVFVAGVCAGLLPIYKSKKEDWDEELRLLYVAMSRAQNWLCLSSYKVAAESQRKRGQSPFLSYIPLSLLETIKPFENISIPPRPKEMEPINTEESSDYVEPLPEKLLGSGMTVLGIDPGIQNVGWSITKKSSVGYTVLRYGNQTTAGWQNTILKTESTVNKLITLYRPHAIAVEKFEIGSKTTKEDWFRYVAGCVANIIRIANKEGIECRLYTPQDVKHAVIDNRKASKEKEDVQQAVKRMCNLQQIPEPHHSADAIAASLCYLRSYLNSARFEGNKRKQERYEAGCDDLDNKRYEAAINKFKEAINIDPVYTEAHYGLGRAYLAQGNLEEAENAAKKSLSLTKNNHSDSQKLLNDIKEMYYKRGIALIEHSKYVNGIDVLLKAYNLDMVDELVLMSLGDAYYLMEDYSNAASYYQKVTTINPNNKIAYIELGSTFYSMDAYREAVDPFQKARNLDPNCAKTCYYLARIHFKLGNWGEAKQTIEESLRIAPTYQAAIELSDGITMAADRKMIRIPTGEFLMGSSDNKAKGDEKPAHTVYVDEFYMDIYPVTNAQYKAFVDANPEWQKYHISRDDYLKHWDENNYPQGKDNHPVTYVNWYAAMAYAQWVGKRLPTEAEWEKAARGGLTGEKYSNASKANHNQHIVNTTSVGTYSPNNYGLHDMTGNVREWCLDEYNLDFYKRSPRRNPMAGSDNIDGTINNFTNVKTDRVLRGNSWHFIKQSVRGTNRFWYPPILANDDIGFRCVQSVSP